jgi:hypothetical protein
MRKLLFIGMVIAAVARAEPPYRLAFWCEFMPYPEVEPLLPVLAARQCDLILHVERADIGDPDLARVCRRARALGVEVYAWFLFPMDDHLYVGEKTLAAAESLAMAFADWSEREDLGVRWHVFDCEPSFVLGRQFVKQFRQRNVAGFARTLNAEINPDRFRRSLLRLNGLLDRLRDRGVRVMGSGNRIFLDTRRYRNVAAEDALNVPFTMAGWDRVSFITYRYAASQPSYRGMIHHYAELARRGYGDRAALDLGLLGSHRDVSGHRERAEFSGHQDFYLRFLDGMSTPADLTEVVSIALDRGLRQVNLFSLDGAATTPPGLEAWLAAARAARPAGGPLRTRLSAARCTAATMLYEGLFRLTIGRRHYDLSPAPADAVPDIIF